MPCADIAIKSGSEYLFISIEYNGGVEVCGRILSTYYNGNDLAQKLVQAGNMYAIGLDVQEPSTKYAQYVKHCKPNTQLSHCVCIDNSKALSRDASAFSKLQTECNLDEKTAAAWSLSSWAPVSSTCYVWDGFNWWVLDRNSGEVDLLCSVISKLS